MKKIEDYEAKKGDLILYTDRNSSDKSHDICFLMGDRIHGSKVIMEKVFLSPSYLKINDGDPLYLIGPYIVVGDSTPNIYKLSEEDLELLKLGR